RDIANPLATILSAALMLDSFGMIKEAKLIRNVVTAVLTEGIGTPELNPTTVCGCSQMGDIVVSIINENDGFKFKKGKFSESISTII
ncbi:MAG: isocitrate/isopropylmalate family dehydrogenase, partial [Saprospiraceae bacterium]